jgi:isoamylase
MNLTKTFVVILSSWMSVFVYPVDRSLGFPTPEIGNTSESRYGAHLDNDGWGHFVVYAPDAKAVNLLLFDTPDSKIPQHTVPLVKAGDDWKIKMRGDGIGPGLLYMYQAQGLHEINQEDQFGLMFNGQYFLSDPYAYKGQNVSYSTLFSRVPHTDTTSSVYAGGGKSIVYDHSHDLNPGHMKVKREDLIVYELHVQDFTARLQGLDPTKRGTYLGLAQTGLMTPDGLTAGIDHLVELGITAVELMPVMEFDEETGNRPDRLNHWGYMTSNFFSPEARYASLPGNQVVELKKLVQAFHDKGIAVFLDVVYNHTAEQSPWIDGATNTVAGKYYNFMGLANTRVYRSTDDGRFYINNTGTGNDVTFVGADNAFTKQFVTDSLAMWHQIYGIDGFRFDLARILADGSQSAADWVDNDPRFVSAHLHAEPWDLGGQWYDFMDSLEWSSANNRWSKWIGKYRDKVRKFSASNLRNRTAFKQLLEGFGSVSDSIGPAASTKPWRSINFLAVHDGYTQRDCVFFTDNDGSHNCWDSGGDENLRREREKLSMGILLTSQGVPLLLQGDEFGRTKSQAFSQAEAHNTYNYESSEGDQAINNVNWIDWRLKDGDNRESPNGPTYGNELFHWTKDLITLRNQWSHFRRQDFAEFVSDAQNSGANAGTANNGKFSYTWEGPNDGELTQLAVIWWGKSGEPDVMVMYNEDFNPLTIDNLNDWSQGDWKVVARSWFGDESDFCDVNHWETQCESAGEAITIKGRSMAILISAND